MGVDFHSVLGAPDNPGGLAWRALSSAQQEFIKALPKAEVHAHLNGCIPLACLQELARDHAFNGGSMTAEVQRGLAVLETGVVLSEISDFFGLFPAIYALTSTPPAVKKATQAVLASFLSTSPPQCQYIELRTTPRKTPHMTAEEYLSTVLDVIESFEGRAALILSVDRRMSVDDVSRYVELAKTLKREGRAIVGVDLCGDPLTGNMEDFAPILASVHDAGLKLTLHIAETPQNDEPDTLTLLSAKPDRLGHATFLTPAAQAIVRREKIPVEICLTSNVLCKTVPSLQDHHISDLLLHQHPVVICTDDTLPFRNSLFEEYALLLAPPPLGLGFAEVEVERIAREGMGTTFRSTKD
ncbi:Metallo-dependent hydrolase [Dacryopinax primogenitus]|uniref:Metallo-dependent hydrolase n=1 Tax=Dacryopinax primogenitus (strain DJM 731) TaxID=1858805 RepID=M5G3B5_DACPD|nr:Metallo-dependent hydrolase [Dacryopinax primogenitus]EJU04696.1 Metallo-dependent hydrolase [Dacryopinax primogenitus]